MTVSTPLEETSTRATYSEIVEWCKAFIGRTLDIPAEKIDPEADFDSLGFDSAAAVALVAEIEGWLNLDLEPAVFFEFPTISSFAEHLSKL